MIKHIWEKIWDIIKKLTNKEILAYLIFGILTTAIDWLVYIGLEPTGLSESNRTLIAWIAAVIFAFITNKIFVFESTNFKIKFILKEFIAFTSSRIATGVFTWLGMLIFAEKLNINDKLTKAVLSVVVVVMNYILSKCFIFNNKKH